MKPHFQKGFTLIEMVIVVAIIGILASIAFPAYQEQVRKSRRADCAGELVLLANAMERHYTLNGSYSTPNPTLGNGAGNIFPATCPIDNAGVAGGNAFYTFSITAVGASTYTIQAAPTAGGPQVGDKCANLTLTNTGVKGNSAGLPLTDCW